MGKSRGRPTKADILKMVSLSTVGHSPNAIGNMLGFDHKTVIKYLQRIPDIQDDALQANVARIKRELPSKLFSIAEHCIDSVTDQKIEGASLSQLAIGAAVFIDKGRLLLGESTQNLNVLDVAERLQMMIDESSKRRVALEALLRTSEPPDELT